MKLRKIVVCTAVAVCIGPVATTAAMASDSETGSHLAKQDARVKYLYGSDSAPPTESTHDLARPLARVKY